MKQRIQELAVQARAETYAHFDDETFDWDVWHTVFQHKFAELIVRECIGCCEQVISDPVPESVDTWLNGGEQCIDEIKQHFGVEE